jgi:hypothetical protein
MPETFGSASNIWDTLAEWAARQDAKVIYDLGDFLQKRFPRFHRARFDAHVQSWIQKQQPELPVAYRARRELLKRFGVTFEYFIFGNLERCAPGWYWKRPGDKYRYGPHHDFAFALSEAERIVKLGSALSTQPKRPVLTTKKLMKRG